MTILRLVLLALGLSHLRGCYAPLCDAARGFGEIETVVTRAGMQAMTDAIRDAEGNLVVSTGIAFTPPEYHQTVIEVNRFVGPRDVAKFQLDHYFGEGLSGADGKWWYSLAGTRKGDSTSGVFFVTPEPRFVAVSRFSQGEWLPFDEAEPRGMLVEMSGERTRALEVTPGGVRRQWTLPVVNSFSIGWWAAERLTDGSIALLQYDRNTYNVILRILGQDVKELVLRDQLPHVWLASAVSPGGKLAVVIDRREGDIDAAIIDPAVTSAIEWKKVTTKAEPGRYPEAAFDGERLIVAWVGDHQLKARTITDGRLTPVATLAPLRRRGGGLPAITILPEGEEILFVWQADEVMKRRVPADFSGLNLLEALCSY